MEKVEMKLLISYFLVLFTIVHGFRYSTNHGRSECEAGVGKCPPLHYKQNCISYTTRLSFTLKLK